MAAGRVKGRVVRYDVNGDGLDDKIVFKNAKTARLVGQCHYDGKRSPACDAFMHLQSIRTTWPDEIEYVEFHPETKREETSASRANEEEVRTAYGRAVQYELNSVPVEESGCQLKRYDIRETKPRSLTARESLRVHNLLDQRTMYWIPGTDAAKCVYKALRKQRSIDFAALVLDLSTAIAKEDREKLIALIDHIEGVVDAYLKGGGSCWTDDGWHISPSDKQQMIDELLHSHRDGIVSRVKTLDPTDYDRAIAYGYAVPGQARDRARRFIHRYFGRLSVDMRWMGNGEASDYSYGNGGFSSIAFQFDDGSTIALKKGGTYSLLHRGSIDDCWGERRSCGESLPKARLMDIIQLDYDERAYYGLYLVFRTDGKRVALRPHDLDIKMEDGYFRGLSLYASDISYELVK